MVVPAYAIAGHVLTATEAATAFGSVNFQKITSSGNWVKPDGAQFVLVEQWSGAGSGGGAAQPGAGKTSLGGGGQAGSYTRKWFAASALTDTVAVTIGAAGVGVSGANGGDGGDTTFGAYLTTPGGKGGIYRVASASTYQAMGGAGTTPGTDGDVDTVGAPGSTGCSTTTALGYGGNGASSVVGAGGLGRSCVSDNQSLAGVAGTGYAAGGGGAFCSGTGAAVAGGNGTKGLCIVTTFC